MRRFTASRRRYRLQILAGMATNGSPEGNAWPLSFTLTRCNAALLHAPA
jgi:hypothetical protein